MDLTKVILKDSTSTLKVVEQYTGTINLPGTSSSVNATNTIPHGYGDDNILISCISNFPTDTGNFLATTPFATTVRGLTVTWDATNVYVRAFSAAASSPAPALTFNYTLTIIIP